MQNKKAFRVIDQNGKRFDHIKHNWIERRLLNLLDAPAVLKCKNGLEYQAIYDNVRIVEDKSLAMMIVSFQEHTDGDRIAIIRNFDPIFAKKEKTNV